MICNMKILSKSNKIPSESKKTPNRQKKDKNEDNTANTLSNNKICPLYIPFRIHDDCLVFVDNVKSLLVLHELNADVLFINRKKAKYKNHFRLLK